MIESRMLQVFDVSVPGLHVDAAICAAGRTTKNTRRRAQRPCLRANTKSSRTLSPVAVRCACVVQVRHMAPASRRIATRKQAGEQPARRHSANQQAEARRIARGTSSSEKSRASAYRTA
jgi:hypothetical protein